MAFRDAGVIFLILGYTYGMFSRAAFTLIETLVVLSILTLMTSMLVLYNRTGERQILLLREKARLINTVLRAKSLALNTLIEDEPACGYGVHIASNTYFIYRDRAINCRTSDHIYTGASDEVVNGTNVTLDPALSFKEGDVADIVFVPPDPQVFLNGGQGLSQVTVMLASVDGKSTVSIIINNAGQISAE